MSTDAQIKTGLKLSEAVKLLEENPGAELSNQIDIFPDSFRPLYFWQLKLNEHYAVKLPPPMPPMAVSVTRADVKIVLNRLGLEGWFEQFCKESGL